MDLEELICCAASETLNIKTHRPINSKSFRPNCTKVVSEVKGRFESCNAQDEEVKDESSAHKL